MIRVTCSLCEKDLGEKEGVGEVTHSICPECFVRNLRQSKVSDKAIREALQRNHPEMPPREIARLLAEFPAGV